MDEEIGRLEYKVSELEKENKELQEKVEEEEEGEDADGRNNDGHSGSDSSRDSRTHADVDRIYSGGVGGRSEGDNGKMEEEQAQEFEVTAYSAFCNTGCTGITKSGLDVSNSIYYEGKRIIATDPSVVPLGTDVLITLENEEQIEATALDTGGDIQGNRIDLLVESEEEAKEFGRQTLNVEVLK